MLSLLSQARAAAWLMMHIAYVLIPYVGKASSNTEDTMFAALLVLLSEAMKCSKHCLNWRLRRLNPAGPQKIHLVGSLRLEKRFAMSRLPWPVSLCLSAAEEWFITVLRESRLLSLGAEVYGSALVHTQPLSSRICKNFRTWRQVKPTEVKVPRSLAFFGLLRRLPPWSWVPDSMSRP